MKKNQQPTFTAEQLLVERINGYYKPGDTIRVKPFGGTVREFTMKGEAEVIGENLAVGYCDEDPGVFMASHVVFKRNNTAAHV